jgi:hypothetical protein
MTGRAIVPLLVASALGACAGARETVRASVDHSEWHQWSYVLLHVPSGGFSLDFPDGTRATGRFSAADMRQIRARLAAARAGSLDDPKCGATPENPYGQIVLSNGGPRTLELRPPTSTVVPKEEGCWSAEADALHRSIETAFMHFRQTYGDRCTAPGQFLCRPPRRSQES